MKIPYSKVADLYSRYISAFTTYSFERKQINDSYYVALVFIRKLSRKAVVNLDFRKTFYEWLNCNTSTLSLIDMLKFANYDPNNLIHFNAFSLLDTIQIKYKND